jgi:hypothetical protein
LTGINVTARRTPRVHQAWLLLCATFAIHIADEAFTGFLDLWNPTVRNMRQHTPWLILPTFTFPVWIALLALAVIGFLILSHWIGRDLRWTIYACYAFAAIMSANAIAHLGFSVYKSQWMSGSYTSPLLLAASIHLLVQASRRAGPRPA